jgi:hypothetical protein
VKLAAEASSTGRGAALAAAVVLLAACAGRAPAPSTPQPQPAAVMPTPPAPPPAPTPVPAPPAPSALQPPPPSAARTLADYRRDVARALYAQNAAAVHRGLLPALLEAVIVVELAFDTEGRLLARRIVRSPDHAAGALARIDAMLDRLLAPKAAQLPPSALRRGRIEFLETFLMTDDGRFQLHALSEGQASE